MEPDPSRPRAVILVVDDDPDIRDLLEMLLVDEGYGVLTAADGHEALRLAERRRPGLILVDVVMPRLGGIDFARRYHEQGGTVPIVLLTAVTGGAALAAVEACAAAAYIPKPFKVDDVLETVAQLLGR